MKRALMILAAAAGWSRVPAHAACTNTVWTSSLTEVLQINQCTSGTCTFTFSESNTSATLSGTFLRPTSGFLQMTVNSQTLNNSTGWAFSGSTIYAVDIPGVGLVVQPLINEDLYNPVIFLSLACPTASFSANWIFGHWDPNGMTNLTSPNQTVAGYFDSTGTSSLTLSLPQRWELTALGTFGSFNMTPTPVACSGGVAAIDAGGGGDRAGTAYYSGDKGFMLYKSSVCHSALGVPQTTINSLQEISGLYAGFAYDTKEATGFNASGASVHQVQVTINSAGCTTASKCTGNGLTSAQGSDTSYLSGSLNIDVSAINSPRAGMFYGTLTDGSSATGKLLCVVARNVQTTASTPPFYNNLFCVAQYPGSNADPLNLYLVSVPQPSGTLDSRTLAGTGYVSTDFSAGADTAINAALQTDGKIVLGGSANTGKNVFGLARYLPTGALDTTFGTGGKVTTSILGFDEGIKAVAVQTDGKILAAGITATTKFKNVYNFALARYNTDGTLDTAFGSSGIAQTAVVANKDNEALGMVLQTDGKALLSGSCVNATTSYYNMCLARYTTTGALDTTFNPTGANGVSAGTALISLYTTGGTQAWRSTMMSDGRFLTVGRVALSSSDYTLMVARFQTDGSLDTTFNPSGTYPGSNTINPGSFQDAAYSVTIQTTGQVVIGGGKSTSSSNNNFVWTLARFNSDGSIDTGFGTNGLLTTAMGTGGGQGDIINQVLTQTDGKILAVGPSYNGSQYTAAVARYTSNGALDVTFNSTGKLTQTVSTLNAYPQHLILQNDGRLLLSGYVSSNANDFLVMRVWP